MDRARDFTDKPIEVVASVVRSGTYESESDISQIAAVNPTAMQAYEMAGIKPEDIDVCELHDAFTINELITYEGLGFCKRGEGGRFIEEGHSSLGGRLPVNTSGGLLAKGHPLGATGLAQIAEIIWQLRGEAGERQVTNAEIGMAECVGGFLAGDVGLCAIHIFRKPE
jgi:acetyl-CoA acetyltransferase